MTNIYKSKIPIYSSSDFYWNEESRTFTGNQWEQDHRYYTDHLVSYLSYYGFFIKSVETGRIVPFYLDDTVYLDKTTVLYYRFHLFRKVNSFEDIPDIQVIVNVTPED